MAPFRSSFLLLGCMGTLASVVAHISVVRKLDDSDPPAFKVLSVRGTALEVLPSGAQMTCRPLFPLYIPLQVYHR